MLTVARQCLLYLAAISALALTASATAEGCSSKKGKCFGVEWKTATPAEVENVNVNARDKRDSTPLHWAARFSESPDVLKALIQSGADVDARDKKAFFHAGGYTPLHFAASSNKNPDVADLLIQNGANVNAVNNERATPLHESRSVNVADLLIRNGADVNAKNKNGWTPLHKAANKGKKDVTELLISNGADVNAKGKNGNTPLHLATNLGIFRAGSVNLDVINLLVLNGADVNARNKHKKDGHITYQNTGGKTPLHNAVYLGTLDVVSVLIHNNADVNAKDQNNNTPLHLAVITNKKTDIAELLIRNGADIDARRRDAMEFGGMTPLHHVASYGYLDMASVLIREGADVNLGDDRGWTPLHWVHSNHALAVGKELVHNGAKVNSRSKKGDTPMHHAAASAANDVIDFLIRNGANVNARDNDGEAPLHWAAATHVVGFAAGMHSGMSKHVKETNNEYSKKSVDRWAKRLKSEKKNLSKTIDTLTRNGANVNVRDKSGKTPLHHAMPSLSKKTHPYNASALLQKGADVNARNNDGETPLHLAAIVAFRELSDRSVGAASVLIQNGANVNARQKNGETPLHYAAQHAIYDSIINLLIQNGASINAIDKYGHTPLHDSVSRKYANEMVAISLLKHRADVSVKNNAGKTALELGKENKDFYKTDAYWALNDAVYEQKEQ